MKKIFIVLFLLLMTSGPAQAWKFNYTYVEPAMLACTPSVELGPPGVCGGQYDDCCKTLGPCDQWSEPGHVCVHWTCAEYWPHQKKITPRRITHLPLVNETCFRPSCYWRPASLQKKFVAGTLHNSLMVQPLTSNTATVSKVIDSMTDDLIANTSTVDMYPKYMYPPPSATGPNPGSIYETHLDSSSTNPNGIHYKFDKFELSTGTSAMEGLLWSWRMLSDKWKGVWDIRTAYEDTAFDRSQLPAAEDSKNIIVISDGQDSDGPLFYPDVHTMNDPGDVHQDDPHSGKGYVFPDVNTFPHFYHTCDAHNPPDSITDSDYDAVCHKLLDQGIKVHVVLYGYSGSESNERLHNCAITTHGQFIPDATPQNLSQVLQTLFASIAHQKIKLIK
jgi:hypothetical protein